MSKGFFGHSSLFHRDPAAARPATSTSTPAIRRRPQNERDQVSALYELGLLSDSDKRTRWRAATTGGQQHPGGARVAGSRTHTNTPTHTSTRSYPNPNPLGAHPPGGLGPQESTQRPMPILTFPFRPSTPLAIHYILDLPYIPTNCPFFHRILILYHRGPFSRFRKEQVHFVAGIVIPFETEQGFGRPAQASGRRHGRNVRHRQKSHAAGEDLCR
jgi:hypothetical protein